MPDDDAAALKARIDAFIATDLVPRMRAVYPQAAVETETIVEVPPLLPDPGSPAEALARRLTGANTTTTVSFASEAGLYQQAGIPAIVCGPGSIDVAHKPDEFITRAELADGQIFSTGCCAGPGAAARSGTHKIAGAQPVSKGPFRVESGPSSASCG